MNPFRCAGVHVDGWTTSGLLGEVARLRVTLNTVLRATPWPFAFKCREAERTT